MPKIGIGIVTYNRLERLKQAVESVRKFTTGPYELVVADDGSTDGTAQWCHDNNVRVITGTNRGVCWNKNRALYAQLSLGCDPILLLEDDARPGTPGWDADWREATALWGHVSYAHPKIAEQVISGTGTPKDPYVNAKATGQCASISADGLKALGFLDTRFKGYGVGHAEWTSRAKRAGFGFKMAKLEDGRDAKVNLYIAGGIVADDAPSFRNNASVKRNRALMAAIKNEPVFRSPWSSAEEQEIFLGEQDGAGVPELPLSHTWPQNPQSSDWEEIMSKLPEPMPVAEKKKKQKLDDPESMTAVRKDIEQHIADFDIKVFLDVGANIGQTVKSVRFVYPDSEIFAFEPVPDTYAKLSGRWATDKKIHCANYALGSHSHTAGMRAQGTSTTNYITDVAKSDIQVSVVSGDDFLAQNAIAHVDYLKIDTEGHDLEVLVGFQRTLAVSGIDFLEVEAGLNPTNSRHVPFERLKGYLEPMGYRLFSLRHQVHDKHLHMLRRCNMTFISPRMLRDHPATPKA